MSALFLDSWQCTMAIQAGEYLLRHYEKRDVPVFYDEQLLNHLPDEEAIRSLKEDRDKAWNDERSEWVRHWLKIIKKARNSKNHRVSFDLNPDCADQVLKTLNDLRLIISLEFQFEEKEMSLMPHQIKDSKRRDAIVMMHWCSGLQHYIIEEILGEAMS